MLNPIGAEIGDRIVLKMDTSRLLKATFLVYMFPILMLILGAGAGEWIARSAGLNSPAAPALLGFGGLAAGLLIMRVLANRLARKDEYRPVDSGKRDRSLGSDLTMVRNPSGLSERVSSI